MWCLGGVALVSLLISGCFCGFAPFWVVGFSWGFLVSGFVRVVFVFDFPGFAILCGLYNIRC